MVNMAGNRFNAFSNHGIGIGLRIPHYEHIFSRKPVVDWFEIISENFMVDGGRPLHVLDQILEQYRVVQHGVSMYFGSARATQPRAFAAAEGTGEAHENAVALRSSLLGQRGRALHARPASLPYTCEAVERRREGSQGARFLGNSGRGGKRQQLCGVHGSEMTEWEFLTEVVERADCGILLDVNNIYVSSQNHEFDPMEYVNSVPAERVAQIHIAGHSKYREIHSRYARSSGDRPGVGAVCEGRGALRATATLLEWDDHIPTFDEVHNEAKKAERYLHRNELAGAGR